MNNEEYVMLKLEIRKALEKISLAELLLGMAVGFGLLLLLIF